ncbi:MAG: NADH-quinone oxidoreductase subunit NuoE family protein [Chloroflexota bacterium]
MSEAGIDLSVVDRIVEENRWRRGAALAMLEEVQEHFGYVPHQAVARLAELTDYSRPYLYGVLSFYDEFRIAPAGTVSVAVCNGSACALNGEDAVMHEIEKLLGIDEVTDNAPYDLFTLNKFGYVTEDGKAVLRKADCIGACQLAPVVRVGSEMVGRLTPETTAAHIEQALNEQLALRRSGDPHTPNGSSGASDHSAGRNADAA